MPRSKTITVYEVLADTNGEGPTGDGTVIFRFRSRPEAERFAARSTCWGNPARVQTCDAPRHLAQRWGMA